MTGAALLVGGLLLKAPLQARQLQQVTQAQSSLFADAGHDHHGADTTEMPAMDHPADHGSGTDGHDHDGHDHEGHHHAPLEVPVGMPVPTLDLVVYEDPVNGWNLELQVSNFRFAPENVNGPSSTDEGHAHLYVNGEQMGRIYGPWHHIQSLPPGEHEIMVELNANGHEPLVYQGQAIADTEQITVVAE